MVHTACFSIIISTYTTKGHPEVMTKQLFISKTETIAKRTEHLVEALQEHYNSKAYSSNLRFVIETGRKYFKINTVDNQTSVHAFIDKKTGDVYKPAGWRGPAKIVRYNLLDDRSYGECISRADWAGGYRYLR